MRFHGYLLLVVGFSASLLIGCGGSDGSGAGELARQRELAEARKEAAQNARQNATIEQLEHRLNRLKKEGRAKTPQSAASAPASPSAPSPEEAGSPSLGDWPGGSGYSAMLGAFSNEENARVRQREATEVGLDAGVLYSSNFSSLRPGFWVVFSGTFTNHEEAEARVSRARELGYTDSYPRFVSP
jgi:cell division septation protein DedD